MTAVTETDRLPVILVLDEINRTDLSRLFGEAFSLLENRDTPVLLPGFDVGAAPQALAPPHNLYVIGTMNLIDQSVEDSISPCVVASSGDRLASIPHRSSPSTSSAGHPRSG